MRLQMRGVDHDPLGIAAPVRQRCENLVEHPQTRLEHLISANY